jgi:hypothetical protein
MTLYKAGAYLSGQHASGLSQQVFDYDENDKRSSLLFKFLSCDKVVRDWK